ncbi:hypothetical protein SUDANB120_06102 [Streptomyces sp. enrichment culture]|uniref:NAD(P)-binding protein n=1 Tax=Streptomyces TaxID=1883 RepID=UPI001671A91C|nr:NAD(P)-binding protein [Streptomyces sp. KD18]
MTQRMDAVVIGGGQAGLAAGCHLRRLGIEYVVLDAHPAPGARRGTWPTTSTAGPSSTR